MSDVVVSTPDGTVSVPVDTKDTEVDSTWLESSFVEIRNLLSLVTTQLQDMQQRQSQVSEQLNRLETQLPGNLSTMIESQQRTITQLVRDSQETLRTLLTPPAVQEPIVEQIPEENVVAEVTPVPAEVPAPATERKRRRI